jgi:hypothetical protein
VVKWRFFTQISGFSRECQVGRARQKSLQHSLVWFRFAIFDDLTAIALDRSVGFILEALGQCDLSNSIVHLLGICEHAKVASILQDDITPLRSCTIPPENIHAYRCYLETKFSTAVEVS